MNPWPWGSDRRNRPRKLEHLGEPPQPPDMCGRHWRELDGACGTLLAEHFPRAAADVDELPNHLFEI